MKYMIVLASVLIISTIAWSTSAAVYPECKVPKKKQADISADYVPGVDVNGVQVTPADINGALQSPVLPSPMVVPVTVDLAERVGISAEGVEMRGNVGFLEVYPDGRVLYNGQDLTQKINETCGARDIPESAPDDGQGSPDTIEYAPVEGTQTAPQQ